MKIINPFLISGYISPKYFCNREKEEKNIISSINNQRNITMISLRRMGKTGLIKHVFYKLRNEKDIFLFYIDILPTLNLNDFINVFGNAIFGKINSTPDKAIKQVFKLFSKIKPAISYDPIIGQLNIEFGLSNEAEIVFTVNKIFNYLIKSNKRIIIAIDEFQQIMQYPEKNVETLLRTNIQKTININYIFSGSRKNILLSMFNGYSRPFYQSTEILELKYIEKNKYIEFIKEVFNKGKTSITTKEAELIINLSSGYTYYVQYLCNKLFAQNFNKLSSEIIYKTFNSILNEKEVIYYNYRNLLTKYQFKVLTAIAKENNVKAPSSKDFIYKYRLNTPSSVIRALKSLIKNEMVYEEKGVYQVYDVFFSRWLERI